MTYSAAYFANATVGEQIGNSLRDWPSRLRNLMPGGRKTANQTLGNLAILAPSLVAEVAPLFLLWDSHLPVWQMSLIMAASWMFTWWLTWIVIAAAKAR